MFLLLQAISDIKSILIAKQEPSEMSLCPLSRKIVQVKQSPDYKDTTDYNRLLRWPSTCHPELVENADLQPAFVVRII